MPIRHSYADHGDACAAAHALDVVGDRWSVIVMRELMLGPKRFNELLAGARGATPTALTSRLRELERAGVLEQRTLPSPARVAVYELTGWGREFEPVLQSLGRWAQRSPSRPDDGGMTPDAAVLALRTMAGWPAPSTTLAFGLGLHDERVSPGLQTWYRIRWGPESLRTEKLTERVEDRDSIACDSSLWSELMFSDLDVQATLASDAITARGDGRRIARRFVTHLRRSAPPIGAS